MWLSELWLKVCESAGVFVVATSSRVERAGSGIGLLKLPGGYSGALWSIEIPAVCPHGCLAEGITERSVAFHCAKQCLYTDAGDSRQRHC